MSLKQQSTEFKPIPTPLVQILDRIGKGAIQLPDFQRDWVWDAEKVRELIVSVASAYPVGSILTMPAGRLPVGLKAFAGTRIEPKKRASLIVLDGQQRLTSLYQAFRRTNGVEVKKWKGKAFHFYLDISVLMQTGMTGDPVEEAVFYVLEENSGKKVRYDGIKIRYSLKTRESEIKNGALPLNILFDGDRLTDWRTKYLDYHLSELTSRTRQARWDTHVRPYIDRITNYKFAELRLSESVNLRAVCYIFEKVNRTGIPLNIFDLAVASYRPHNIELKLKWKETEKDLSAKAPMQPTDAIYFLQGVSLLDSLHRKRETQSNGAVTCRTKELLDVSHASLTKWWPVLESGYLEAGEFMRKEGIVARRVLPYSTLIIPLSAILAYLKNEGEGDISEATHKRISRWYWCCVFGRRYSGNVETTAAQDFEQVITWVGGGTEPSAIKEFSFRTDSLLEVTSLQSAIYKGVLCLSAREHAKDWGGGDILTEELFSETNLDHHHIFPKEALKELLGGAADPRMDSIVNKTLISAKVNRTIGGHLPSKYLGMLSLSGRELTNTLKSHGVKERFLRKDNWNGFVLDRREYLRRLIAEACGRRLGTFTDKHNWGESVDDAE